MDEYLSTILTDADLSRRWAQALQAIKKGLPFDQALEKAGIDKAGGNKMVRELTRLLRVSAKPAKPKPAKPKRGAPHKPGGSMVIFTDGGSRGNPGQAACAAIIYDEQGEELLRRAKKIGVATNNVAEYEGVILALELASQLRAKEVTIKVDSELVVKQIQGSYKVKNEGLKPYHARACELKAGFSSFSIEHVRREQNKEADKYVNATLDGKET